MLRLFGTPEQLQIMLCKSRIIGVFCGRRWGKNYAIRNHHIYSVLSQCNFQYLHTAPKYAQAQHEWNELRSHEKLKPFIKRCSKKDPYPIIE